MVTSFVLMSWVFCALTVALLILLPVWRPWLVVRPSFWAVVFLNLTTQWGAAVSASTIEQNLRYPFDFLWVVHGFPLVALLVLPLFWERDAVRVYGLWQDARRTARILIVSPAVLFLVAAIVLVWYLAKIPWEATGLYAVLFFPETAMQARENSLALLDNPLLKYAYSLFIHCLGPLLGALLLQNTVVLVRRGSFPAVGWHLVGLFLLVGLTTLHGAKSPSAFVLFAGGLALLFLLPPRLAIPLLGGGAVLGVLFPTLIVQLGEGRPWDMANLAISLEAMLGRMTASVVRAAVWHFQYVEQHGFLGIAGMGKMALLFGELPVNAYSLIGREFVPAFHSATAGSSFVVSYYDCLGLASLFLSLFFLVCLDGLLVLFRFIDKALLVPCLVCCLAATLNLSFTWFTTALLSYGLLIFPLMGVVLSCTRCYGLSR